MTRATSRSRSNGGSQESSTIKQFGVPSQTYGMFFLLGCGGFFRKRDDESLLTKEVSNGLGPTVAHRGFSLGFPTQNVPESWGLTGIF